MRRIVVLALTFVLSVILAVTVEFAAGGLLAYAVHSHEETGKPLPDLSAWVIRNFGDGGIFCLLLITWSLFLLYVLSAPPASDPDGRLIYGFIYFSVSEAILCSFFAFASLLPVVPRYGGIPAETPMRMHVPHILLAVVSLAAMAMAIRKIALRCRSGRGDAR